MTENDPKKKSQGFLARMKAMSNAGCDCGCCGSMKIVPKETQKDEVETDTKTNE